MILTWENRSTQRETRPGAMLSTTNLTCTCYGRYTASFNVVPCSMVDRCQCFRVTCLSPIFNCVKMQVREQYIPKCWYICNSVTSDCVRS